jgi:2-polyprenyl-3-methyl-5-hydroxy-6-metoxy-1,4-benzoquinol methylase
MKEREMRKAHWEKVYTTKKDNEVGWYQRIPETSLSFIRKYARTEQDSIIDVGGGHSSLASNLHHEGFQNLTVIDISKAALERNKSRLMEEGSAIKWLERDILSKDFTITCDLWHDRALFHFLITPNEINTYVSHVNHAVMKDGHLILATFSTKGPDSCSGLPVRRYNRDILSNLFNEHFNYVEHVENVHITTSGNEQHYIWLVLKKL